MSGWEIAHPKTGREVEQRRLDSTGALARLAYTIGNRGMERDAAPLREGQRKTADVLGRR